MRIRICESIVASCLLIFLVEMKYPLSLAALAICLLFSPLWMNTAHAANYGSVPTVDGSLGSEWNSITPVHVAYDPNAPSGDFSGGPSSNTVSYDIYFRADSTYVYGLLQATPAQGGTFDPGLLFANLYFSTDIPNGSNIGFEFENNRAFVPGVSGYYNGLDANGLAYNASVTNEAIEFAIPWSYLMNDPQGLGFDKIDISNPDFQFRLSQSFGYSVAGGSTFGLNRLGLVTYTPSVPDSGATVAMLGLGLIGMAGFGVCRRLAKV